MVAITEEFALYQGSVVVLMVGVEILVKYVSIILYV